MEQRYRTGGREYRVSAVPSGQEYRVEVEGRAHRVRIHRRARGTLILEVDGQRRLLHFADHGGLRFVGFAGRNFTLRPVEASAERELPRRTEGGLEAEMPGLVRSVRVSQGDSVEKGHTLVILEAMKMEIRVTAPERARVLRVFCREGQKVERGEPLVEWEPV